MSGIPGMGGLMSAAQPQQQQQQQQQQQMQQVLTLNKVVLRIQLDLSF